MSKTTLIPIALAAIFGCLHFFALAYIWAWLPQHNPLLPWMIEQFAGTIWFSPLILCHDLLINILLALPLAVLINWLVPKKPIVYIVTAISSAFVVANFTWFVQPLPEGLLFNILMEFALLLVALSAAFYLLQILNRWTASRVTR